MLVHIPQVLTPAQVADCRQSLETAEWTDGKVTAGYMASRVKDNMQLPEGSPLARRLGTMILEALDTNQLFISASLPLKVVPPLFNRYTGGQSYGGHIDGGIRPVFGTPHRVRTDLAATLFLSEPDTYQGGELVIDDAFGMRQVKLPAGDMVLYPGTSVHHVEPVTSGVRLASFFWIQSMVRDDDKRRALFELDTGMQRLGADVPGHEALVQIMGVYHNLLRMWSDT